MAASKKKLSFLEVLVFVAYLVVLVYFLFFAEGFGRTEIADGYRYNLVPFQEIKRYFYHVDSLGMIAVLNLAGNIVAFMPMGYFFPRVSRKVETLFSTVLICFVFSLIVELIQLFTARGSFDVDDLILNTLGGLIGYIIYLIIHKLILGKKKKKG